jgi:uncharacterized cofD-like protein
MSSMRSKNIVVIGGGTGTYTVLTGLKKYPVNLTAIVSMADDGGSTRVLREEFGVLPPGSVRPAMVALSGAEKTLAGLFNYRFSEGSLKGHNFGNLFLTVLTKQLGSFEKAIEAAAQILKLKGRVIPSTLQNITLVAELEDGTTVRGETNIDIPKHDGKLRIKKIWLEPTARRNPRALQVLAEADLIVLGPGDLFTSIIPNILVEGIRRALLRTKARKLYVCNLMTKFGETTGFNAKDFVDEMERYMGKGVLDVVLVNTKKPSIARIKRYEKEGARFVEYNPRDFSKSRFRVIKKDLVRERGFIRHDSQKLAKVLTSFL